MNSRKVEEKDIEVRKVKGEENPADLMTKNITKEKVERFSRAICQAWREGRAEKGLETAKDIEVETEPEETDINERGKKKRRQ